MILRAFSWVLFAICVVFAYFTVRLPGLYYVFDANGVHRGDYMIGWFWITLYGIVPTILLALLIFFQRYTVSSLTITLWTIPIIPVVFSAVYLIFVAN